MSDNQDMGKDSAQDVQGADPGALRAREQRLEDLVAQHGAEAVVNEGYRRLFDALVRESQIVQSALGSGDITALGDLTEEELAGLAVVANVDFRSDLTSLFERTAVDQEAKDQITRIWQAAKIVKDDVLAMVQGRLGSFGWDHALSDGSLSLIEAELERKMPIQQESDRLLLETYEPILSALQSAHLNGSDVSESLRRAVRDQMFRDLLDRFVSVHESSPPSDTDPFIQAAHRYSPIARVWHDLRLVNIGRTNHWVTVVHDRYFDLDTGIPQVELRVLSYSKQLFHTKDDIDDIMYLGELFIRQAIEALDAAMTVGAKVPPSLVERLVLVADNLQQDSARLGRLVAAARGESDDRAGRRQE
jgi:hypothetical protein